MTVFFSPSALSRFLIPVLLLTPAVGVAQDAADNVPDVSSRSPLSDIRVSPDGTRFVDADGRPFVVWGVNYDHDSDGRLLDEYWIDEWQTVVEDFAEIQSLGANCVRIHLQLGMFMETPTQPREAALNQLGRLLKLAEDSRLYLDLTGLACYHRKNIPSWYDELPEAERWAVQSRFWEAIAKVCSGSPAVFCYDLMNEPIIPGRKVETEWLTGELGGKHFVQRLTLDAAGRTSKEIAAAWVRQMSESIRRHDQRHLITVGVIPWVFAFGGGQPLFYSPEVSEPLDFVAVHFYPEAGKVEAALTALKKYDIGKPLVIEEMFPLKCSPDEVQEFIKHSAVHADGWISFYWGTPAAQLRSKPKPTLSDSIVAAWLGRFQELSEFARHCQDSVAP